MAYSLRRHLQAVRLTRQRNYGGAADCYREMAADSPAQWELRLMVADCLARDGRLPEALEEVRAVAAAKPNDFLTLKIAARLFIESGDHEKGREYVERALRAPVPGPPSRGERFSWVLAVGILHVMRLMPRYRRMRLPSRSDTYSDQKWRDWAPEYLAWHDATLAGKHGGTGVGAIQQADAADEAQGGTRTAS